MSISSYIESSVAERSVTGSVEYYETDDTSSMYGTFSLSINDPTGMYETYNALLRNITSEVQIVVQTAGKYGVQFTLYCDYRSATGISQIIMPIDETVSTMSSIPLSLSNLPLGKYGFNIISLINSKKLFSIFSPVKALVS